MKDKIDELADEFNVDLEDRNLEQISGQGGDSVEMEAREATVIKPFKPENGFVKDETHNYVLEDGNQFSLTVKHRPECPSCKHVLAENDEPNQLSGECSVCGKQTCHRNQSKCESCGTIFCPEHAKGHGLKDKPYCSDCLDDVVEDIGFDRRIEKRKQFHSEEMDQLEKELRSEKQAKKLKLQEVKQQRDQIRQDWKVVIQLLDILKDGDEVEEDGESDAFGGSGAFSGSGAFTSGKDYSNNDNSSNDPPNWLKKEFAEIKET